MTGQSRPDRGRGAPAPTDGTEASTTASGRDRRTGTRAVCVVGDSYVHGTGDPAGGWVARLAGSYPDLTVYNLGVRRDDSTGVGRRWESEVSSRAGGVPETFLLLSWGVNDADPAGGALSIQQDAAARTLDEMIGAGYSCAFVGPPPVPWPEHDRRAHLVDAWLGSACRARGIPFLSLRAVLDPGYRRALTVSRSHPLPEGYALMWDAIGPFVAGPLAAWQGSASRTGG